MAVESKGDDTPSAGLMESLIFERNPRGIPGILFIEDIGAFIATHGVTTEALWSEVNTLLRFVRVRGRRPTTQ
jgi:hypothetical protein